MISSRKDITHYDLFATSWMIGNQGGPDGTPPNGAGNNFHQDFDIFDSFGDVIRKTGEWQYCNANHASYCVGFPRDCGKSKYVGGRWFRRFKSSIDNNCHHSAKGNFGNHATFQILKRQWCPVSCTDFSPDRVSVSSSNELAVDFTFDYVHKFPPHQVGAKIGPYEACVEGRDSEVTHCGMKCAEGYHAESPYWNQLKNQPSECSIKVEGMNRYRKKNAQVKCTFAVSEKIVDVRYVSLTLSSLFFNTQE